MNRLKKRIFCGIISLAMFMSIVPTQAFAVKWVTTKTTNDGSIELPYSINDIDYGVEIKNLIGEHLTYVIPELERVIEEALLQDDRIEEVNNFNFEIATSYSTYPSMIQLFKDKKLYFPAPVGIIPSTSRPARMLSTISSCPGLKESYPNTFLSTFIF